jgi:outer membrane protein assembly complex protein YaeT
MSKDRGLGAPYRRRGIGRHLAVAAALLAALVVAGLIGLHTPPGRRWVLAQALGWLRARQIAVSLEDLDYNLATMRLSLRAFEMRGVDPDLPPLVAADRVVVDLSASSLLWGRLVVDEGRVEGVHVHYVITGEGADNVPPPSSASEDPLELLLRDVQVDGGVVRYENRQLDVDAVLPIETVAVTGNATTDRHHVQLVARGGTLRQHARTLPLESLAAIVDAGDDDARLERVTAIGGGVSVTAGGAVTGFADPRLDVALDGQLDLERVAALLAVPERLAGQVTLRGRVRGPLGAPDVEAHVESEAFQARTLDPARVTADVRLAAGATRLDIDAFDVTAPFGRVAGRADVSLDAGPSRAAITAEAVDVARVLAGLGIDTRVGTTLSGRVDASWPARDVARADGTAALTLVAPDRPAARLVPVAGRLHVTAAADTVLARIDSLRAPGIAVDGVARLVDRTHLEGRVRTRVDLEPGTATAARLLNRPPASLTPVVVRGDVDVALDLSGSLDAPVIGARLAAPAVQAGDAAPAALAATLVYERAIVAVERADVWWQSATLSAAGSVGVTASSPMALDVRAEGLQIGELLRAIGRPDIPADGTVSLDGAVRGTPGMPAAEVTVAGGGLVAYDEAWGTLAAEASLAGRDVTVSTFTLTKPDDQGAGTVTGRGRYQLDTRAIIAELQSDGLRIAHLLLPGGSAVTAEQVRLSARAEGRVDDLRGRIDIAADGATLDARALGTLTVDADLAAGGAEVRAAAPAFGAAATGRVELAAPYPATMRVEIDDLPLAQLLPSPNTPLSGQVTATIDAAGPLATPSDAIATANLTALSGTWQDRPFELAAPAAVRYEKRRIGLDQVVVNAEGSTARVSGELPLDTAGAPGAIAIDVAADLTTLAGYAPPQWALWADGDVTVAGTISGTLAAVEPALRLGVTGGSLYAGEAPTGLTAVELQATVTGSTATLETFSARVGDGRLSATGALPLGLVPGLPPLTTRDAGPGSLTARVDDLPLAGLPGVPPAVSGTVGLGVELALPSIDVEDLHGTVVVDTLALDFNRLTLAQTAPTRLVVDDGTVRLEAATLDGSAGRVQADGAVAWRDGGRVEGGLQGQIDLGALAALADGVSAGGAADVVVTASGTTAAPEIHGTVDIADAAILVDEPTLAVEALSAAVILDGRRLTLTALGGTLNGGALSGSGFIALGSGGVADADVSLRAVGVVNDFPLDLRSVSTSELRLTAQDGGLRLGGTVTIADAGLTGDINFDEGILAALSARQRLDLTQARNPLLDALEFDVAVRTTSPIVVENNLANAEVSADVRVLGSPYELGLKGQLQVSEGGEITLNERRYEVERGIVSFVAEREILPSVDLGLRTSAQGYDITVTVSGPPGRTDASFVSDPSLPEPDIMAVLVTGRTLDEMRGEEYEVAKEQALSYLAGRVGSPLGRGLERVTGLSSVKVEPELIANETNPGARLTVGQDISRRLGLVYSVDLTNSNDQIWKANYDLTRRFRTSLVRQEDNSVRLDVRHDVRIGGQPAPERQARRRPRVRDVHVLTDGRLPEAEVRDVLGLEAGDSFHAIAARRATTRLLKRLREDDRLQARVHLERAQRPDGVVLTAMVEAGPVVTFAFDGATPPQSVVDLVRQQWGRGVFDAQRLDDVVERLQGWLMQSGYFRATVTTAIDEVSADRRQVTFSITPGPHSPRVVLAFDGATAIDADTLAGVVRGQDLELQLFTDPIPVTELLERYYTEQGYLAAQVDTPRIDYAGEDARVSMRVTEGARFTIGEVTAQGVAAWRAEALLAELPLGRGDPFYPVVAETALRELRRRYWARGYNDVRADYGLTVRESAGRVDLHFRVTEGAQTVVDTIEVAGNQQTSAPLIAGQTAVTPEQPLDIGALATSRSALYETGAFSLVDIEQTPLPAPDSAVQPVALTVLVREVQPVQFRYGLSADTERGLGGLADLSSHNLLGNARVLGVRGRYDRRVREGRVYFNQPSLRVWPVETSASLYYRSDLAARDTASRRIDLERLGLTVQQDKPLGKLYRSSLGFRLERARTIDPATPGIEERTTVAPLSATVTRDGRDDVLDAVRGSFMSHALQLSPRWLGSDATFLTYFGQFSHYLPLQAPRHDPLTRDLLRPRLVFASSVRLGLAHAFGAAAAVPRGERFFAGGSTTMRGFPQDGLGALGAGGAPLGGQAMAVVNGELRFPLLRMIDGVGFVDIGNVFTRIEDIDLGALRESAGFGLRVRTPWFLGRADLGWVLDPRPGERRWRLFLGIGQAF